MTSRSPRPGLALILGAAILLLPACRLIAPYASAADRDKGPTDAGDTGTPDARTSDAGPSDLSDARTLDADKSDARTPDLSDAHTPDARTSDASTCALVGNWDCDAQSSGLNCKITCNDYSLICTAANCTCTRGGKVVKMGGLTNSLSGCDRCTLQMSIDVFCFPP